MDYRLDLFNAIDAYQKQMTEDDALFFIAYNTKDGDLMMGLEGNVDLISNVMANDNELVMIDSKEHRINFERSKSMVLNIAINILRTDASLKSKFELALKKIS